MRKIRSLAAMGAVCAVMLGTVLTGSAYAATGGGCGSQTSSFQAQACASWVTGQGFSYNFFLNGWENLVQNAELVINVHYCRTPSVATSSTSCTPFTTQSGTSAIFSADHLGQYPAGTITWGASRDSNHLHGIAYSALYWVDTSNVEHLMVTSKKVYW